MTRALELAFEMAVGPLPELCPTCHGAARSIAVDLGHAVGDCTECGCPVGKDGVPVGTVTAPGDPVLCFGDHPGEQP